MSEPVYQVTFTLAADPDVPDFQTRHDRANIADTIWPERLAVVKSEIKNGRVLVSLDVLEPPLRTKDQQQLVERIRQFCGACPEIDLRWVDNPAG